MEHHRCFIYFLYGQEIGFINQIDKNFYIQQWHKESTIYILSLLKSLSVVKKKPIDKKFKST